MFGADDGCHVCEGFTRTGAWEQVDVASTSPLAPAAAAVRPREQPALPPHTNDMNDTNGGGGGVANERAYAFPQECVDRSFAPPFVSRPSSVGGPSFSSYFPPPFVSRSRSPLAIQV